MKRWVLFFVCAVLGLAALVCGLLVPAHLRAVDASLVQKAGGGSAGLVEEGLALAKEDKLGAAQLIARAAREQSVSGWEKLGSAVTNLARRHPGWEVWGGNEADLESMFGRGGKPLSPALSPSDGEREKVLPITAFVVRLENRERVLERLRRSQLRLVKELLRVRELTNTVVFPPSQSASGQALDAALTVSGLLAEEGRFSTSLSNAVFALAAQANRGRSSQPLEQVLMDLMSLGQRFSWGQLAALVRRIEDAETLRLLAHLARKNEEQIPVMFTAVQLSGDASGVAKYLMNFSQTGSQDLGASLRFGAGGVNELLRRNQRLYHASWRERLAAYNPFGAFFDFALDYSLRGPRFALSVKWVLYLFGGYLIAAALHFARPAVSELERPLQVRGFHVAREILFGLGFLLAVLLLSEPFLAQESQKAEVPFRLRLPTVGSVVPAGIARAHPTLMNQLSLLTLLLFFVLQGLLYTACLVKLAEIRRQKALARIKLRLLENEEHLFDAGLYLGFAGTIISLILVSMGVIRPSLMAAYGSTSFGIIFVSIFKIFHLRPERRKLLLEAEAMTPERMAPSAAPTFATPS
jgi:hypothetical protein